MFPKLCKLPRFRPLFQLFTTAPQAELFDGLSRRLVGSWLLQNQTTCPEVAIDVVLLHGLGVLDRQGRKNCETCPCS